MNATILTASMPTSQKQLQIRIDDCLENIKNLRAEAQIIAGDNAAVMNFVFVQNQFFQQLTTVSAQHLREFQMLSSKLTKILELAEKATKQEMQRRSFQKQIDEIEKEAVAKIKQNKKKTEEGQKIEQEIGEFATTGIFVRE